MKASKSVRAKGGIICPACGERLKKTKMKGLSLICPNCGSIL